MNLRRILTYRGPGIKPVILPSTEEKPDWKEDQNSPQVRIIELLRPQTRKPFASAAHFYPDTFQGTDCTEQ